MEKKLLTSDEAAEQLGLSTPTLYGWLSQSDTGDLVIRGQPTTVQYFQGGPKGQGRIRISRLEVERLLSLMAVTPIATVARKPPGTRNGFRHITTKPGRPED